MRMTSTIQTCGLNRTATWPCTSCQEPRAPSTPALARLTGLKTLNLSGEALTLTLTLTLT